MRTFKSYYSKLKIFLKIKKAQKQPLMRTYAWALSTETYQETVN